MRAVVSIFPEGEESSAESLCVVGKFIGEELQRDVATELQVFRFVDDTHPTAPDLAEDAVMGNRLTHGLRRSSHSRQW